MKKCSQCNKVKSIDKDFFNSSKGQRKVCKDCLTLYHAKKRKEKKDWEDKFRFF